MLLIDESPSVSDRFLRPVARTVVNTPIGKAILTRWPVPWLFKRPLADYDFVARLFHQYQLGRLEGDILELGCFLGFGTARLAALARPSGKVVHTADWFLADFGKPETVTAVSTRRYLRLYPGLTQREVFDQNTRAFPNIAVHAGDIMKLTFPPVQCFVCSVIDAGHEDAEYYLKLSWSHTTPGGLMFLNDYLNPECPELVEAGNEFISANRDQISAMHLRKERRIIAIVKRPDSQA